MKLLDCTLRDGGYYNAWNFSRPLIHAYLDAMPAAGVDAVELGFRSLSNKGFKGACAFSSDDFLRSLPLPQGLQIGVMVNASELVGEHSQTHVLAQLFPEDAQQSPVDLVRIACHVHEFEQALPAAKWLKERGFVVGFNLMQMAGRPEAEVVALAREAARYPLDVLYFADSMGSMDPTHCVRLIQWLRQGWPGALGIHTHDNMGLALQNSLQALEEGVSWADATVTGMGRGPGNARTEELALEMADQRDTPINMVPLMRLLHQHFKPLQNHYGWGTNPYYYLAGKYGIHPTYIQEMLGDSRYDEEDVLAVIDHLRVEGGKKFSLNTLDAARHFYQGQARGGWQPSERMQGRQLLLLGSGPGVGEHRQALEQYIRKNKPLVMALNTQSGVASELIDLRVACHPVRLLADCEAHTQLPQPLITPASMLPEDVQTSLAGKELYDYGLQVAPDNFAFEASHCTLPTSMVIAYALAVATSGQVNEILMAGFDGYTADDPRNREMDRLLEAYQQHPQARALTAVTPSRFRLNQVSIYGLCAQSEAPHA